MCGRAHRLDQRRAPLRFVGEDPLRLAHQPAGKVFVQQRGSDELQGRGQPRPVDEQLPQILRPVLAGGEPQAVPLDVASVIMAVQSDLEIRHHRLDHDDRLGRVKHLQRHLDLRRMRRREQAPAGAGLRQARQQVLGRAVWQRAAGPPFAGGIARGQGAIAGVDPAHGLKRRFLKGRRDLPLRDAHCAQVCLPVGRGKLVGRRKRGGDMEDGLELDGAHGCWDGEAPTAPCYRTARSRPPVRALAAHEGLSDSGRESLDLLWSKVAAASRR